MCEERQNPITEAALNRAVADHNQDISQPEILKVLGWLDNALSFQEELLGKLDNRTSSIRRPRVSDVYPTEAYEVGTDLGQILYNLQGRVCSNNEKLETITSSLEI
jgi:hypothetical protein